MVSVELERILSSQTFSHTIRQSQFLRFIVSEAAQGRGENLKEYLIGVEVFKKPDSFDPRLDSIVRVEAARLRSKLKTYYETEGNDDQVIIKIPARGYRPSWELRAAPSSIAVAETRTETQPDSSKAPGRRRIAIALAALGILALGTAGVFRVMHREARLGVLPGTSATGSAVPIASVAVLGFSGNGSESQMEYLGEGMTEGIISALSHPKRLRIVAAPRGASGVSLVGNKLGVDAVITGSVRESKGLIRITANVIRCATGEYLWSGTFERGRKDVFPLQDEVAAALRKALIPGTEGGQFLPPRTSSPEAYKEYLTGRHYLHQRSERSLRSAIDHFQRAIALDPRYAMAYAGLASAHSVMGRVSSEAPDNSWLQVKWAATKALEHDERLAEAHTRLAGVLAFYQRRWASAEPVFKRALEFDPDSADAHHNYAHYLIACSRLDEALREMRRAQELDPVSPIITAHVGLVYYMMRQYDRAIEEDRKAIELSPGFYRGHWEMARAYLQKSMPKEAIAELEKAKPGFMSSIEISAWLSAAYARLGDTAEAHRLLQSRDLSAFDRAVIYAGLRDRANTLQWLERTCDEHSIWSTDLNIDPMYDWLRADPRFRALVKKMNL